MPAGGERERDREEDPAGTPQARQARGSWLGLALAFFPALSCAGFIFWLSSQPDPLPFLPRSLLTQDKLLHALEYAVLAGLLALPLRRLAPRWAFLSAALLASAYGASDEIHQSYVPGRDADVYDWITDSLGAVAGAAGVVRVRRRGP